MPTNDEQIAAYRRRYEELKASGQAPRALPGPSDRPAPMPIAVIHREVIPGGWYWTTPLKSGETLRIQMGATPSTVSLIAWRAADTSERLNYADTVKIQWTSALAKGRVIFSDMGRVMLSIVEDSCGFHDALVGGSNASSNQKRYGDGHRNTRDNFVLAAQKLGMGQRDVPPCIAFFAPVRVDSEGHFKWQEDRTAPHDYVDVMLSIVEDSCGFHDALVGGSNASSNQKRYGDGHRNTRDNFVLTAQKLGMGQRDVPPCIAFFAPVRVDSEGHFKWQEDRTATHDYVDLRAEMDLLVALSNCPHPLDPTPDYLPTPVEILRFKSSDINADDLCRTATDEARRGFNNNAALAL